MLREFFRQRRAAHQQRHVDAVILEIRRRGHHLVRALHQQPRKADRVRLMLAPRLDQIFRRNLDPQVDHLVAVVAER